MPDALESNGKQERRKKPRKRAKRPGAPRSSKIKREKRAKHRTGDAAQQVSMESSTDQATQRNRNASNGAESSEDLDNRIWVGGLPPDSEEKAILEHFKTCGKVRSIKLVRNSRLIFRGSCFISFRRASSLNAALELDGTEFGEQTIKVKKAALPVQAPDFQVFVAGIPYNATEEVLRKDFAECGEIAKFKMLKDKASDKFKGVIFVTYKSKVAVDAALKFNGTDYGGKTLVVRLASEERQPKEAVVKKEGSLVDKNGKTGKGVEGSDGQEDQADGCVKKGKKPKRKQTEKPEEAKTEGTKDATNVKKKKKSKTSED